MALAFFQHIGHTRHVEKSRVADLRPVGADREEEVALIGDRLSGIHARLHRVSRLVRLERDTLNVVLQEHRDVRKKLPELLREFLEIEFVNVERVGALHTARFGVIQPVGRGDNQLPGRGQHTPDFLQKVPPVFQVLDHFECECPQIVGRRRNVDDR